MQRWKLFCISSEAKDCEGIRGVNLLVGGVEIRQGCVDELVENCSG